MSRPIPAPSLSQSADNLSNTQRAEGSALGFKAPTLGREPQFLPPLLFTPPALQLQGAFRAAHGPATPSPAPLRARPVPRQQQPSRGGRAGRWESGAACTCPWPRGGERLRRGKARASRGSSVLQLGGRRLGGGQAGRRDRVNSSRGPWAREPGHGEDRLLGTHLAPSPQRSGILLRDRCRREATGCRSVLPHACLRPSLLLQGTGSCTSLPVSCPLPPSPRDGQSTRPAARRLLLHACPVLPAPCKDKFAVWSVQGFRLAPTEAVGLRLGSWGVMVALSRCNRPRPEHWGAPSPLPTVAKPQCLGSWRHSSSG